MSLEALRAQLAAVDRAILERIAERLDLSRQIGQAKSAAGLPTRDFHQEKAVLERAAAVAREVGLSPELARRLLLGLIDASLGLQERDLVSQEGRGAGSRALVIGGVGKMGRWMGRFLASQGYDVHVADPAVTAEDDHQVVDWRRLTLDHELVVVAAPLRTTAAILEALAESPPRGLLFDIASLKSPLRGGLARLTAAGARVTSIHPMFGPATELLSGRHVVFVDVGVPEATAAARELFASTMAIQVTMDLDSHDRLIAYVLGLSHAVNIAFFTALAESHEAVGHLERLSSTTFDAQLRVAGAVARESPSLYYEIQALNDYGGDALEALGAAVERLRAAVGARDEAAFRRLMERGSEYLAGLTRQEPAG